MHGTNSFKTRSRIRFYEFQYYTLSVTGAVYRKLFLSTSLVFVINSTNKDADGVKECVVLCLSATVKFRVSHFFKNIGSYRGFVDSRVIIFSASNRTYCV
jgi:hypothetical protein